MKPPKKSEDSIIAINYIVPEIIAPIPQINSKSCRAAMYTMMYSWKKKMSVPVETAITELDQHDLAVNRMDSVLLISDNRALAQVVGMTAEQLQNLGIEGWANLLRWYGLLWVSYAWHGLPTKREAHYYFLRFSQW